MKNIHEIADMFQAAGIDSPFAIDYQAAGSFREANPGAPIDYNDFRAHDRLGLDPAELPEHWMTDVHDILSQRRAAALSAEVEDFIRSSAPEALRDFLLTNRRVLCHRPKPADLRDLAKLAAQDLTQEGTQGRRYGKPAYQPEPGCNLRLKLREAWSYDYEQASYADHSRYIVPVEVQGEIGDRAVCNRNLRAFCQALRTHNGFAGSGDTWNAELIERDGTFLVILDCRSSISD